MSDLATPQNLETLVGQLVIIIDWEAGTMVPLSSHETREQALQAVADNLNLTDPSGVHYAIMPATLVV